MRRHPVGNLALDQLRRHRLRADVQLTDAFAASRCRPVAVLQGKLEILALSRLRGAALRRRTSAIRWLDSATYVTSVVGRFWAAHIVAGR